MSPAPSKNSNKNARMNTARAANQAGAGTWFTRHLQSALFSLGRMLERPLQSFLTAAVIGIALSLPAVAFVLLSKVQAVSSNWVSVEVAVFCKLDVNNQQAKQLAMQLEARDDVESVRVITKEQARDEYRTQSRVAQEALDLIGEDVLPASLLVRPAADYSQAKQVEALMQELREYPGTDIVQWDRLWVKKLFGWLQLIDLAITIFGLLLGLAVILIVGNTIRLEINNRKEEIEVVKLLGATNAFVRRPFLYMGLWQGMAGGLLALVLVLVTLVLIGDKLSAVVASHQDIDMSLIEMGSLALILGFGMLLGLLGAWLAVGQHLRRIEPS